MQTNLRSTPQDTKPTPVFSFYCSYKCCIAKTRGEIISSCSYHLLCWLLSYFSSL